MSEIYSKMDRARLNEVAIKMAAEIERLKETVNAKQWDIDNLNLLIISLREKQPVTCGECKNQNTNDCICAYYDGQEGWKTDMGGANDFCSRGVRKEAPDGK